MPDCKTCILAILVMHAFVHCWLAKKQLISDSWMHIHPLQMSICMAHLGHAREVDPQVILSGFVR